jgi:hypothetical protein
MKCYLDYYLYLPEEICCIIKNFSMKLVKKECGKVVSKIIHETDNTEYNEMGYVDGIHECNESKHYVYSNTKMRETALKRGITNHGHFGSVYVLYYLKQEPNFYDWYKFRDRMYVDYDKSGNEAEKYVVYEMDIW